LEEGKKGVDGGGKAGGVGVTAGGKSGGVEGIVEGGVEGGVEGVVEGGMEGGVKGCMEVDCGGDNAAAHVVACTAAWQRVRSLSRARRALGFSGRRGGMDMDRSGDGRLPTLTRLKRAPAAEKAARGCQCAG